MRGRIRHGKRAFVVLVCAGAALLAGAVPGALAADKGAVTVAQAKAKLKSAARELERAQARYREARSVLDATRLYSTHDYSDFAGRHVDPGPVGRWVWLARHEGWPWGQIDLLMHVVARESSGQPGVQDYLSSGHWGLMQLAREWWNGEWGSPAGDPTDAAYNLRAGWWIVRHHGWSPWAL